MANFVGDNVVVTAVVADATGTPETPDAITVVVTGPDGNPVTVSDPQPTGTGLYQAIVAPVQLAGSYQVKWEATVSGFTKGWVYSFTVTGGTSLPPFASPSDVAARWRPLTAAETITAQALVEDASALLRARFPGIDGQAAAGALDPNVLTMVVAGMVKRALVAPEDGVASQSQTDGPFALAQTFSNPMRNVFLTAADLVLILGYQPAGQSKQYGNTTIRRGGGW